MPCQVWELSWLPQKKGTPTTGHKFCHGPSLGRKEIPHRQGSGTRRGEACTQGRVGGGLIFCQAPPPPGSLPGAPSQGPQDPGAPLSVLIHTVEELRVSCAPRDAVLWMEGGQWESANISAGAHTCTQLGLCPHVPAHTHVHTYTRAHRL